MKLVPAVACGRSVVGKGASLESELWCWESSCGVCGFFVEGDRAAAVIAAATVAPTVVFVLVVAAVATSVAPTMAGFAGEVLPVASTSSVDAEPFLCRRGLSLKIFISTCRAWYPAAEELSLGYNIFPLLVTCCCLRRKMLALQDQLLLSCARRRWRVVEVKVPLIYSIVLTATAVSSLQCKRSVTSREVASTSNESA